jgi:hypothetical protein
MNHVRNRRLFATTVLVAGLGLGLAACGGSSPASRASPKGGQTTVTPGAGGLPGQAGSGKVTDVSGSTAQVQSDTAQVAVSWTGSTTFTQQVSVTASAVKVGSCVMVTSSTTGTKSTSSTVQASTVRVIPAANGSNNGSCSLGRPGGAGRPLGGTPPTGRPSGAPSGAPGRGVPGGFGGAFGKVTNVSSTGFTVASASRPTSGGTSDATKAVTVVTSAKTTYSSTEKATSSAVKVGRCVTSQGKADDTGAITATSIAVTDPVDGECGFGGFGGRSPGGQS